MPNQNIDNNDNDLDLLMTYSQVGGEDFAPPEVKKKSIMILVQIYMI